MYFHEEDRKVLITDPRSSKFCGITSELLAIFERLVRLEVRCTRIQIEVSLQWPLRV